MKSWLILAVTLACCVSAVPAHGLEVRFPLTVDHEVLRLALRQHLREDANGQLTVRLGDDGCRTLTLRELALGPAGDGRMRLTGRGTAEAGFRLFGWCWGSASWDGVVDVHGRPGVAADWRLRLRDLDTRLYDRNRQPRAVASLIWELMRDWAEAELATFAFDLGPPVAEIRAVLAALGAPAGAATSVRAAAAAGSLRPVGVQVDPDAVRALVALDVPPPATAPSGPAPPPSAAELERWKAALDGWDGFVAFAVKDLGGTTGDATIREELLDVLVDARRGVVSALERGPESGEDPVRGLFLSTWERLRTIVRRVALTGGVENRALRFLAFLAAGDALAAVEGAAPAGGLELSGDGLRRLARALDPGYPGDPVEYSETPDPALRKIFRFRDPDAPPRRFRGRPPGRSWLGPRVAFADTEQEEWWRLGRQLDRWVPTRQELGEYRDVVARLLTVAADRSYDPDLLAERFEGVYFTLVKTVAWQESCWRQFARRGQEVTALVSKTGDVGLMQVNRRIWRGFFDPGKLTWNAAYNAGAGAEILLHLLFRHGQREATAGLPHAARATYSAYHGGPRSYRRYRSPDVAPHLRAIDRAFWVKYQAMTDGTAGDLVLCLAPRPA